MRRHLLTVLNLVFATSSTPSDSAAHAAITDEQALASARQLIRDFADGQFDAMIARFDDALKGAITRDQFAIVWNAVQASQGKYQNEVDQTIRDVQGLKGVVLTLQFEKGSLDAHISVNAKGQVGGLSFMPVPSAAVYDLAPDEQEITFQVGDDTIYGTQLIPAGVQSKAPVVLLISGSGPTDRDGNSTMLPGKIDSHRQFARILADAGVASLRYDKIGTGKTGLGTHPNATGLTFDLYVDTALAGYRLLSGRPEIDPGRLAVLGHSEGGLIALVAADRLNRLTAAPPAALVLAAPLAKPFMQTLREQFADRYASAVQAQAMTRQQADAMLAELDQIVGQVLQEGTIPAGMSAQWAQIFSPTNLKFLQAVGRYDPARVAEGLPPTIKVLVLCGQKDQQIPCADVRLVVDGFKRGGNTGVQFFELENVNHVFKEIEGEPNLQTDYTDASKPFSREAARRLADFVKAELIPGASPS